MQPMDLSSPREVEASRIPLIGPARDMVRLLRTRGISPERLCEWGAHREDGRWWRMRSEDFPFDALDAHLPRAARRSIVPEVVDLIPSSSWFASLANLLRRDSWDDLRRPLVAHHGGCQDCGDDRRLEAHESWSYDDVAAVQTLDGILVLCRACHETRHLGRAKVTGRFDQAFGRLCTVNRIRDDERMAYIARVSSTWRARSAREWQLRLPLPEGLSLRLRPSVRHEGDGWLVMPPSAGAPGACTRVVDVGVGQTAEGVVLVGVSDGALSDAYGSSISSCNSSL
jgi:hypothetical protein